MKPKNIKEFQALVQRYETITLEEINKEWNRIKPEPSWTIVVAKHLTGFGSIASCTLCQAGYAISASNPNYCRFCVYNDNANDDVHVPCMRGLHTKTYEGITTASTPEELLNAYRNRAVFLKSMYSKYLEQ